MKTKKFCLILTWVILIVGVALVGNGFYCGNIDYVVAAFIVVCLFGVPLDFYCGYLKEKANPLNYENRRKALDYVATVKTGSKDDFVAVYGEDMYETLLDRGYIHELRHFQPENASSKWEVTRLGLNVHNKKLS